MKRLAVILLFVLLVVFCGVAAAEELTVLQPKGGTFKQGTFMTIKWDYTILTDLSNNLAKEMEICLARTTSTVDAPNMIDTIARVDIFSGKAVWRVTAPPGTYRLQFYKRYYPLEGSWAVSDPFTVEKSEVIPVLPPMPKPIRIINPVQGQVYYSGTSMTVQWDKSNIADYPHVYLQICWPDGTPAASPWLTPNTGSYVWPIRETAENSLRESIYTPDKKYKGMSGTFQVKIQNMVPGKVNKKIMTK
jgi:hypothetical protein